MCSFRKGRLKWIFWMNRTVAGKPPNGPSGPRRGCAVRAFCPRQNLGAGGIHFRRALKSRRVEPPCGRRNPQKRTVKIDIFVFGVKGSTAYKTGPSYWMPVSCAGLIFSSGKSFRHHTLSLSIKYETTSTYCFKRDLRNMRFPAR